MEWQPIESAPRDGKCLLWVDTDDGGEVMVLQRDADGIWVYDSEPIVCADFWMDPTHWMPLPPPPRSA